MPSVRGVQTEWAAAVLGPAFDPARVPEVAGRPAAEVATAALGILDKLGVSTRTALASRVRS